MPPAKKRIDLNLVGKRPEHKLRKKPALAVVSEKPIPKKEDNIFGIAAETPRYTDSGRITKAGWILEFYRLRNGYCLKLYDEAKAVLDTRAYMLCEKEHYKLLLDGFDKACLSAWQRKEKLSIAEMKALVIKAVYEIQSNIVSNVLTILPD